MRAPGAHQLVVLSRPNCHLCDEMCTVLDRMLPRWGLEYEVFDVDRDPDLRSRYGTVIPVLLWNGRAVGRTRLDERRLQAIVRRQLEGGERD